MDLRQLYYFVTIVEEGQITAAAKRLHMAQPPLSQQLKALEEELGVQLLKRQPRHVDVTDAGRLLYHRAQQILNLTDSTRRELLDIQHGQRGTLSLGMVSSSGSILCSPLMDEFHRRHPGISFEIYDGNTFKIIDMLTKGLIEVGIVRTPFKHESFYCKFLPEEPMVLALTDDLDWCPGRQEITMAELNDKPLIIYRRFDQLFHDTCEAYNFTPTILCRNDDARTTILWANTGLGMAVIPQSAFSLAEHGRLHQKIISERRLYTRLAAIWPKGTYISTLAETFLGAFQCP